MGLHPHPAIENTQPRQFYGSQNLNIYQFRIEGHLPKSSAVNSHLVQDIEI
jgi:hypothetical protein